MLNLLSQFASSSSGGIGALGLNAQSFVIQLLTFIIALLILRKWAFKPILKVMDERRETIEQGVKLGEEMKKEKADFEAEVEKQLHDARQKADEILANANDAARETIKESEDTAKEKAANILKAAEERITQETAIARQNLESELVGLIADVTEAVLEEKVDQTKDSELIKRTLKEVQG
ncbi:MAG TPA: F0F1 ATP synthase subunit B [Candidatus Saccharimonadales bacterium]|nr:F0F1 ATP synthase subunit B [Candidatus Saccharimonadales bacterium]